MKNQFYQLIAAIVATAMGTTAITVKFGRPNAFTSLDWEAGRTKIEEKIEGLSESLEAECAQEVVKLEDRLLVLMENKEGRLYADIKLWASNEFHPKTKKIPPQEVAHQLDRHESLLHRLQDQIADNRDKTLSCCHKMHTSGASIEKISE